MGVKTRRYHVGYHAIEHDDIPDDTLTYSQLDDNEIQLVLEVPLLGGAVQSVAADVTGTPAFAHTAQILRSEHLKHLKSAQVLLDFEWAATADGTLQLYDETAASVLAETSTFTGGESDDDLIITVTETLRAGNRIVVRANVTAAGAAGETVKLYRTVLKLILGIS